MWTNISERSYASIFFDRVPQGSLRQSLARFFEKKAHRIQEIITSFGARVVFLLPYSPDLSPIELCWSKLKQCLRTAKARTTTAINQALTEIINQQISSNDAMGWFNHCGLFI